MPAEEGDLRLVEQSTIANWVQGRLELFLDGSWGQVCTTSASFSGSDVAVACRQLGVSGGAVAPNKPNGSFRRIAGRFTTPPREEPDVFPEVALLGGPGCSGSEQRLLDCVGGDLSPMASRGADACFTGYEYYSAEDPSDGLFIACVAEEETGATLQLYSAGMSVYLRILEVKLRHMHKCVCLRGLRPFLFVSRWPEIFSVCV